MANLHLYPKVVVVGKSFEGVTRCTVPNQSLSLREIVSRFIRRESLPISKEGYYEERFGDIEKMSKMDLVDQYDKIAELKAQIAAFEKRRAASSPPVEQVGVPLVNPPGQGAASAPPVP